MANETFVDRLIEDRIALRDKIRKLDHFVDSTKMVEMNLSSHEEDMLDEQLDAMYKYMEILDKRIAFYQGMHFKK